MKSTAKLLAATALGVAAACGATAQAQVLITNFNTNPPLETFFQDDLYASWAADTATIISGPTSYDVTATGYGSNYKFIGEPAIIGAGNTHIELDVTLSGPAEAAGKLGPIITLVDGDGTRHSYAWYGQQLGDHLLTRKLTLPTGIGNLGTIAGLDLDTLTHMHMELDPSSFTSAAYTVQWKNLALVTAGPGDFDANKVVDGYDFILWQRTPGVGTFAEFSANFGNTYPVVGSAQGVPEPTAAGLLAIGALGLIRRTRRSRGA